MKELFLPDYNSPASLKDFLTQKGMAMQKKFGQNFLVNQTARKHIVDLLSLTPEDTVWEIGPGLGCMSREILNRGAKLVCFEIDRGFAQCLHEFFHKEECEGKFRIVQGDVLKTWKKEYKKACEDGTKIKLFGNLPYNIAATFVADTITFRAAFEKCVFTIQKEVAQRMAAPVSSDSYSGFSVLCQWAYDVKKDDVLGPGNFWPRPTVDSQTVVFTQKLEKEECLSPEDFVKVVHTLFANRRKTIANNIKKILPQDLGAEDFCEQAGISPKERAENLSVNQFICLSNLLYKSFHSDIINS